MVLFVVVVGCLLGLLAWRFDVLGVRVTAPWATVATAFDPPLGAPGYTWTREGRAVDRGEVATFAGPDHCHWESATLLNIGWPPPRVSTVASEARLYIRDPYGAVRGTSYRDRLDLHARLPADARPTGYRLGSIELYLSGSDQDDAIYVVAPSGAERWPRSDPMSLCA